MYSINRSKTAVRIITTTKSSIPDKLKGFGIKTVRVDVGDNVYLWTTADTPEKMGFVLGLMEGYNKKQVPVKEWTEIWHGAKEVRENARAVKEATDKKSKTKSGSETKSETKKTKKTAAKKSTSKKAPAKKSTTKKAAAKKAA